jgi:uncharacterized protein (DUF1697 family)
MITYIAILRGINVGGKHLVRMNELKDHLTTLNFINIRTYIQSGNVIFEYDSINTHVLQKQIAELVKINYGFRISVIVKTISELSQILSHNPFINTGNEDLKKLHVTFLSNEPDLKLLDNFLLIQNPPDEYFLADDVIYLFCPNGYGRTKFTNNFIENKLDVQATTRNWRTTKKLFEIATKE